MKPAERMELKISLFLRYGVLFAGSLILLGWIFSQALRSNPFPALKTYQAFPLGAQLVQIYERGDWGGGVTLFGLGCLILLPVLRVVLSLGLLLKLRERHMAMIASLVLLGLILSFAQGFRG